jgi:hypothetical protein
VTEVLKTILRGLAVTVALTAGALATIATLYVLARVAPDGATLREVADWYRVDVLIVGTAALAGLVADSLRWIAAIVWQAKPDPCVRLTRIMRQNLA